MAAQNFMKPFALPSVLALIMLAIHALGGLGWIGSPDTWGNLPRSLDQIWGILSFHLRHGSLSHWFSNAVPLIILAGLAGTVAPRAALRTWILLPVLSGFFLWIWGRPGAHIGASALTYGWFYFVVAMGLLRRDRASIAVMMIACLLFGSMIWAFIAPSGVSWEGHMAGALAAVIGAFTWRRLDPLPEPIFKDDDDEDLLDEDALSLYATRRPKDPWEN